MVNIILSPSQQNWNKCIIGDTEEDHTFEIAKLVKLLLSDYDCNVFLIPKEISGTEAETLSQVVTLSNEFSNKNSGQSFHLDIHTDGGYNGNGSSGFYISDQGKDFISIIHQELSKLTLWIDGGISKRDLYVLRATYAVSGLIELSFHDKYNQAKDLHDNMDLYAQAILRGLVRACGLTKIKKELDPIFKICMDLVASKTDIKSPEFWYQIDNDFDNWKNNIKPEWIKSLINNMANYIYTQTNV